MKNKSILTVLAALALGVSAQAAPITFNFLENGANTTLGSSSTFTQSGATLKAYASSGQTLYAKNSGAGEQGLGINSDPSGDHEIYGSTFISLLSSTVSGFDVTSITTGSTTSGEIADFWFSTTLGSLGIFIGSVSSDTTFNILSAYQNGYLSVTAAGPTGANVLLATATGYAVPDSSSTILLLGSALTGLGLLKRKFVA